MRKTTYLGTCKGRGQFESGWYAFVVYQYEEDGNTENVLHRSGFTFRTKAEAIDSGSAWCDNNGYDEVETVFE
jgi:hypothetical protein